MEFKRVKLLSGMLSAAAIAAMTGAPVLAEEAANESLFLTNTLENDQDQEVGNSGTVEQFLGGTLNSEEDGEEDKAFDAAETAETEETEPEVMIPMAAAGEETKEDASEFPYADAVQEYNAAVLPELTVSLAKNSSANSVLEEQVAVEAPAFESKTNSAPALQDTAEGKNIVVASPNVYLNIHAEPAMSSEVLGKMYSNDLAIELRKEDDRWTKIRSGNVVGYVMNEYLE